MCVSSSCIHSKQHRPSQNNQTSQSDTAKASSLSAGGNVSRTATGAGKDSNVLIQGSTVTAGNSAALRPGQPKH